MPYASRHAPALVTPATAPSRTRGSPRCRHGTRPARHGPRADLQVRLREALARRGLQLRKLAAPDGLVHAVACHSRVALLRTAVARGTPLAGWRAARDGRTHRGQLGDLREHRL